MLTAGGQRGEGGFAKGSLVIPPFLESLPETLAPRLHSPLLQISSA